MNGNLKEALRWIRQADKDLGSAKNSLKAGDYEWSCFIAQQSAEKVERMPKNASTMPQINGVIFFHP